MLVHTLQHATLTAVPLCSSTHTPTCHSDRCATLQHATLDRCARCVYVCYQVDHSSDASGPSSGKDSSLTALMEKVVLEARSRFSAERSTMYVVDPPPMLSTPVAHANAWPSCALRRYVCDHAKGEIWSLVAMGLPDRFSVKIGQGISGLCAKSGETINVRDATQ